MNISYDFLQSKLKYLRDLSPVKYLYEVFKKNNQNIYLVGGFIRDSLLSKSSLDLDFTLKGDTISIARDMAKTTGGSFIVLDDQRGTARVVFKSPEMVIDLCHLQGENLNEDLVNRDFSINALAIPIESIFSDEFSSEHIADISGGIEDLNNGIIRAISRKTLEQDPLRLVRAYRFQGLTDFKIEEKTEAWIKELVPELSKVSTERVRDELFYLLAVPRSYKYIKGMAHTGILKMIFTHKFQEFGVIFSSDTRLGGHSLNCFKNFEHIINDKCDILKEWEEDIDRHLQQPLASSRKRGELLKLASLFTGVVRLEREVMKNVSSEDDEVISSWGELIYIWSQNFRLSVIEGKTLRKVIETFGKPSDLPQSEELSTKDIFRFLRKSGHCAIDALLMALADALSDGEEIDLSARKSVIYNLLREYFVEDRVDFRSPRFLSGDDLKDMFNIPEGPEIGRILDLLDEAQGERKLQSSEEAIEFVENFLNEPEIEEELPEEEKEY